MRWVVYISSRAAYQQRHHPVVVEDIDVVGIARDGLGKWGLEEVVAVLDHEYAGTDEAGKGEKTGCGADGAA